MSKRNPPVRINDEAFWQQQEQRLQSCLGQPCCTLSGICNVLMSMEWNFSVVIQGERDCANSFHLHKGPAAPNFFSTNLDEEQVTTGETDEILSNLLDLIVLQRDPGHVLVLGTCMSEMIGDRFEKVVEEAEKRHGIPMRALHTSGLKLGSQADMLDWLFQTLASFPSLPSTNPAWLRKAVPIAEELFSVDRVYANALNQYNNLVNLKAPTEIERSRSLNLIGLPKTRGYESFEPDEIMASLSIEINGQYPMDDWLVFNRAGVSAIADLSMYPRLTSTLKEHEQKIVEVPLPVGIEQTELFYRRIAEAFGKQDDLEDLIADKRENAREAIQKFAARFGGIRMAMGLRLLNNYQADQLAYDGLGDVQAIAELGLDITLLVQGPPEDESRLRFGKRLKQLGCELPFKVFPDPWNLSELLKEDGYDVCYLADHSREEAYKAGIPMIVSREMSPYFVGVSDNVRTFEQLFIQCGVRR